MKPFNLIFLAFFYWILSQACNEKVKKNPKVTWEFEDEAWHNKVIFKDSTFTWESSKDDILSISSGDFLKYKTSKRNCKYTLVLIPHKEIRGDYKKDTVYLDAESLDVLLESDSSVEFRYSTEISDEREIRKYVTNKKTARKTINY
jgi:hypothetical protein